jgi:hypothetical protein
MKRLGGVVILLLLAVASAHSVILFDTGDPTVNTTAPGGMLANSGWQYQGDWGWFLATPIAPNFFVSAAHIGQAASQLTFGDSSYSIVESFGRAGSDLLIWKTNGTFTNFAPLYTKRDETGQHLVVIGRGTQRGEEIMLNGTLRGWNWGTSDGVRRWGENDVAQIVTDNGHDLLYATFDQHPNDHPNESHLSSGDSGGAVFLTDNGVWKLAGINFAVDDLYTAPSGDSQFKAAIFDARGFYTQDPNNPSMFIQISDPNPVPTGFYASRISSELAWIASVISDPHVGIEGNLLTITYWRLTAPSTDIVYEIQQSSDLVSWTMATTQEDVLSTNGDLQQIKAKVDPGTSAQLFLRVSVTRP